MRTVDIVIPTYNNKNISNTLEKVIDQKSNNSWEYKIILVDDGSTDDSIERIPENYLNCINVYRLDTNQGRAKARNYGAKRGTGEYILFLDSDCQPKSENCFYILLNHLINSIDVAYGPIQSCDTGFWPEYINYLSNERSKKALLNNIDSFTSAYFALARNIFDKCGGFNENYIKYGFEDKDLILRLEKCNVKIKQVSDSIVYHSENYDLYTLTTKFEEAGKYSSKIFSKEHPSIYERMRYSKIDVNYNPMIIKPLLILLSPIRNIIIKSCEYIIKRKYVPFKIKSLLVKASCSMAYSLGTAK
jgi:glycosyltransferase involved in cell wall biosynthesis